MQIDGVPVLPAILENERQIKLLTKIVDKLVKFAPPGSFSQQLIDQCQEDSWKEMADKYPNIIKKK